MGWLMTLFHLRELHVSIGTFAEPAHVTHTFKQTRDEVVITPTTLLGIEMENKLF